MVGAADNEGTKFNDDDLPEGPLHIQKAESHDYQPTVDVVSMPSDHENARAAGSKTSSTSVIDVPGPSSSKRANETYK